MKYYSLKFIIGVEWGAVDLFGRLLTFGVLAAIVWVALDTWVFSRREVASKM